MPLLLHCLCSMERIEPAPNPLQKKMNGCNELEFPGKTYQLNSRPCGITAVMSFLICLILPLWLVQPLSSLAHCFPLREQTVSVNDWLREHVQDKPRASLHGNIREETKEWLRAVAEWNRSCCFSRLKRPIL